MTYPKAKLTTWPLLTISTSTQNHYKSARNELRSLFTDCSANKKGPQYLQIQTGEEEEEVANNPLLIDDHHLITVLHYEYHIMYLHSLKRWGFWC